jgi:hypothetical protein
MVSPIELRYDMDYVPKKAEGAILSSEPPFYLHQATSPAIWNPSNEPDHHNTAASLGAWIVSGVASRPMSLGGYF